MKRAVWLVSFLILLIVVVAVILESKRCPEPRLIDIDLSHHRTEAALIADLGKPSETFNGSWSNAARRYMHGNDSAVTNLLTSLHPRDDVQQVPVRVFAWRSKCRWQRAEIVAIVDARLGRTVDLFLQISWY